MGLLKHWTKIDEANQQCRGVSLRSRFRKMSADRYTTPQNNDSVNRPLSDAELLKQARDAQKLNFRSLKKKPEVGGSWQRVEGVGQFVIYRGQASLGTEEDAVYGVKVLCTGRLDASLEEVTSILRSKSESEHNLAMSGLYEKGFIFGSFEREIACSETQNQDDDDDDDDDDDPNEQLAIKTKSFSRTAILGRNEQWCYLDYFRRKDGNTGFTISKRALPSTESTPGRIVVANAKVNQLHGLNASYVVDKLPDNEGVRVVYHTWFDPLELSEQQRQKGSRRKREKDTTVDTSHGSNNNAGHKSFDYGDSNKHKSQVRRLLALAHGVTKLPEVVRRRRFGVQVPVDLNAVQIQNSRCPCCTHSLASVKMSLSLAASAIANRSLGSLKKDTRRCFLCGYLVCVECWSAEKMESMTGRIAAIVVCTRCRANVEACEYSEVFAGTAQQRAKHSGTPRVVEDAHTSKSTVSLLIDFLSTFLLNATAGSAEHIAAMTVIRTLLRQSRDSLDEDYNMDDEYEADETVAARFKVLGEFLSDEQQLPSLDACKLGNASQRNYPFDLPSDPKAGLPRSPIPTDEEDRMAAVKATGILQLADLLAPSIPATTDLATPKLDTHDLQLLCELAVKTLGCSYSFVTVMSSEYEHVLATTNPDFAGAAVPREQTTCQHALMSPHPFMITHLEADVRFQNQAPVAHLPIRFYVGFPMRVPRPNAKPGETELTVGMLCCIDSKPRSEITRTQYATMERLADTGIHFLLQKGRQLQLETQQK